MFKQHLYLNMVMANIIVKHCKSLENFILIDCTYVTQMGVQMALQQLPGLKIIKCDFIFQAYSEMKLHNPKPTVEYALTNWFFGSPSKNQPFVYLNDTLTFAASLCPSVVKVHLQVYGKNNLTDQDLSGLIELKSLLRELIVDCRLSSNVRFTFDDGILPLLKFRGISICKLNLRANKLFEVDASLLVELCPNLKYLNLDSCRHTTIWRGNNQKRFKPDFALNRLKTLKIRSCDEFHIPSEDLLCLLSTAHVLTNLSIIDCHSLTNKVLQQIMKSNSFSNLKRLVFDSCDSVTKKGIDLFMNAENALETISLP